MITPDDYVEFERFLDRLDDYLYERGYYTNGRYIKEKCKTYEEVEKYLNEHCTFINEQDGKIIIRRIRDEVQLILKSQDSNQKPKYE